MKLVTLVSCCLALSVTAPVASAQRVSFRGKIEVAARTNQILVHGSGTELVSPTIDLIRYAGQHVRIDGVWNGSAKRPEVEVYQIAMVRESFAITGKLSTGGEARFAAFGNPGEIAYLGVSPRTSFTPIATDGVLFLDPNVLMFVGAGRIGADGKLEIVVPMPNDPTLIGRSFCGQAAIYVGSPELLLTNPDGAMIEK